MAYGLPKYEARITVPTGGYSVSVTDSGGTATVTLAAGDYYPNSSTALLSTFATALTSNSTLAGTYTCTSDDDTEAATGRVTLSASGGGNVSVTWSSTTLRDLLGFTGNLSGATTYTSTGACKYIYLPNVPRAEPMAPDGSAGVAMTDSSVTVSPSGTSKILAYNTRYVNRLAFRMLTGRKTWTAAETYANESLESFYLATIAYGIPLRYHYDRATDGTYVTERVVQPGAFAVSPAVGSWVGSTASASALAAALWNFGPVDLVKYV